MGAPDAAAQALIAQDHFRPVFFGWLDILGDPIRATNAPYGVAFSGTGDADLDGFTYDAVDQTFVAVSPVQQNEGGASTVTVTLSGLIGSDNDLLNFLGDRTRWQGRFARFWGAAYNDALQRVGGVWEHHSGYISSIVIVGDSTQQVVRMEIESYLAFLNQPSNRTYLSQSDFDPGDRSADLSIAIANGTNQIAASASSNDASGIMAAFAGYR